MNRRQFMARTAALNVALSAAPRAFAAPERTWHMPRLERVVADARFAPSVAFAAAMAERGTRVSTTDGDLTSLWFDDLARHFAASGADVPVAGLTSARTALVMIELARGPGVRVLWRAEHTPMPDGSLRHEMHGSARLVERAAELSEAPDWSAGLVSVLAEAAHLENGHTPKVSAIVHSPRAVGRVEVPGRVELPLSSWVIAPRRSPLENAHEKYREEAP